MEENNLKIKFKIATIMFILNTFSNDIIKQLSDILDIKLNNRENKSDNINIIIEFLKKQKEKDIDEFEIILKQVGPMNINKNENNLKNNTELDNKKTNIFGATLIAVKESKTELENANLIKNNINNNKYKKKRNYLEMKNESDKIKNLLKNQESNEKDETENNISPKSRKNRNYNRKFLAKFLKDNNDNHYYYHDNNGNE